MVNLTRLVMRAAPLLNAPVTAIAAAPGIGKLLRRNVTILRYTGRRSGRTFSIPVSYRRRGAEIEVAVKLPDAKTWWRNFVGEGGPVTLMLDDTERTGHAVAQRDSNGRVTVRISLA